MNEKITHVIVTYTGTHYMITAPQELKLRELKLDQQIRIGGNTIKARNIAEVPELEEYYRAHPDKRPPIVPPSQAFPGVGMKTMITNEKRIGALEKIKGGLLKYIEGKEYQGTAAPKEFLKLIENKIRECEYSAQPTQ